MPTSWKRKTEELHHTLKETGQTRQLSAMWVPRSDSGPQKGYKWENWQNSNKAYRSVNSIMTMFISLF